jgi:hypothetical protein
MPRRFRAPAGNGEVLADPPFADVPRQVAENRRRLDRADVRIDDWDDGALDDFRRSTRAITLMQAWEYLGKPPPLKPGTTELDHMPGVTDAAPLIVAGHQPELFHPGVWVKNFALNALAKKLGGVALNLVVDNDTAKANSVRVPTRDANGRVELRNVPFDAQGEVPFEAYRVRDSHTFDSFADRVAELLPPELGEPLLKRAWAEIRHKSDKTVGEAFVAARRCLEREWGCDNLELPVSHLADAENFLRFAFLICGDAARFAGVYNAAVQQYRDLHGLRSRSHPVPDLATDGEWQEAPFWAWSDTVSRRGRVWVRKPSPDRITFRFDNGMPVETVSFPFAGYGVPYGTDGPNHIRFMNGTVKLRPRALTLTLFARVCLGDFFVHGIGGGKYDEVTDTIIRDYFGLEPPAYQVVSATLHLPLPAFPTTPADVLALARRERDAHWNPHRHLPADTPAVRELVERHRQLEAADPADAAGRKQRFRDFRAIGEELRPRVAGEIAHTREERKRAEAEAAANAALMRRDFSWVLYPEATLRPFLQRFLDV